MEKLAVAVVDLFDTSTKPENHNPYKPKPSGRLDFVLSDLDSGQSRSAEARAVIRMASALDRLYSKLDDAELYLKLKDKTLKGIHELSVTFSAT